MKILIVGNFNFDPNFRGIRDFFKSYGTEFDNRFIFYIVGKCNKEELLLTSINSSGNTFKINRITYVDDLDIFYQQVDFCLNYVNYGSGENVKMLEALVHGRPVINTSYGETKLKRLLTILGIETEFKPSVSIKEITKSKCSWFDYLTKSKKQLNSNLILFKNSYSLYCKLRLKEFKRMLDDYG